MKGIELKSVAVKARLLGDMADVVLDQLFVNSAKVAFELSYLFPVPPDAQISGFTIKLGERIVQSQIEESEDAFKKYDKAIGEGNSAGMIEALRNNILQLTLGNILPGEEMTVSLSYHQELKLSDNQQELDWRIPFVVAPRYSATKDEQSMSIQPNIGDNNTVISLEAEIIYPRALVEVSSPSHPIQVSSAKGKTVVRLAKCNEKPESDFVLHFSLDREPVQAVYTESNPKMGSFSLLQITPTIKHTVKEKPEKSRSYGFVLDHSGSMEGEKLTQAKLALKLCMRQLSQGDFFTIIAFDDKYITFSEAPVPYTQASLEQADSWIDQIVPEGGTEIFAPLSYLFSVLNPKSDNTVLLFTDGQVSDEKTILNLVAQQKGLFELFPFGIDTAVNESFMDGIAREGNGIAVYIYPGERIEDKVLRQFDRIHAPYWAKPRVMIPGSKKQQEQEELTVFPKLPDKLFAGETYNVLCNSDSQSFELNVLLDGKEVSIPLPLPSPLDQDMAKQTLPSWWALEKIRELESYLQGSILPRRKSAVQKEIITLSKKFGVLSTFTSLVAVMPRKEKAKGMPSLVNIPLCSPKGWDMLKQQVCLPFHGGFPEAEPIIAEDTNMFQMPVVRVSNEPSTPCPTPTTLDDIIRQVALQQKANGSVGEEESSVALTIDFVLGLLASGISIPRYGRAIQKAVDFLLSQELGSPLLQACALQWCVNEKILDTDRQKLRIQECQALFSPKDKQLFEQFVAGNLTPLWEFIDQNLSANSSREEAARLILSRVM